MNGCLQEKWVEVRKLSKNHHFICHLLASILLLSVTLQYG